MKPLIVALLVGYAGVAAWGYASGGNPWEWALSLGAVGVVAFLFGYAIDLLIFGLLAREAVKRWREKGPRPSAGIH